MEIFNLLSTGASFDTKRFNEDINIFKAKKDNDINVIADASFFKKNKDGPNDHESIAAGHSVPEKEAIDSKSFMKKHHIKVTGSDIPAPVQSFQCLAAEHNVFRTTIEKIFESGYKEPTAIQAQAIPLLLKGRDLLAMSPTGSGKTLAFSLPIIAHLSKDLDNLSGIKALVISPTRELAQQIWREFMKICGKKLKVHLLSKQNIGNIDQFNGIVVTTPLRLVHAIKEGKVQLKTVNHIVIDEADKLFELGFINQIDEIFAACTNPKTQKAFFSATMPSHLENLANSVMKDPVRIIVGKLNSATETIEQELIFVGQEEGKILAVRQLLKKGIKPPVLIFVDSIEASKQLFNELAFEGVNVDVINSERSQQERDNIIKNFRLENIWVLIATELLGRGIDFKGVNLVINYDFPKNAASYIHRIGRTGRAGRKGKAITFFTKQDGEKLRGIANVMKASGCDVPEWMLQLRKNGNNKKNDAKTKKVNQKRKRE